MGDARIPLLLDVDTGIDDTLALFYAVASPDAEIVAVTCLSGNAPAADTDRNTRAVLALAGRGDIEVAIGRPIPLRRPLEVTPETHGPKGIGYAEPPDPPLPGEPRRFGPQLIVDEARRRPGELTLVTLGPLTNLAIAVLIEPELPRLLKRWILMGGTFGAPGNTSPVAEWNVHCDPEAARICFGAWQAAIDADPSVPRALAMGLNTTEKARIFPGDVAELAARAGDSAVDPRSPIVRTVNDALRFYFEFHERYDGFYGAFIHDPLVVAAALDPSLVRTEPAHVDVDTSGGPGDAQTIADWRKLKGKAPNVDVAVEADAEEFLRRLVDRVGALAASLG